MMMKPQSSTFEFLEKWKNGETWVAKSNLWKAPQDHCILSYSKDDFKLARRNTCKLQEEEHEKS